MAKVDDRDLDVAGVYARSMLELAEQRGEADALQEELDDLTKYLDQNRELEEFLGSPLVDAKVRAKSIEKAFRGRASDLLVDALQVINRKGRLGLLPAIAKSYLNEYREKRGLVEASVSTVVPLNESQRSQLVSAITTFSGKRPILTEKIDPSLIGGIVVEVAGKKLDTSVAARLRNLSAALSRRASQEIHSGRTYLTE
jgi:F-type H+-transporting ATPase subunit delta